MSEEESAFERIETLIPFKEPEFGPRASMGKLNLESSAWAISAKLGRYLLSGAEPQVLGEVSRAAAAFFTDWGEDDLVPIGPEGLGELERRWFGRYAGGASFFRAAPEKEGETPALVIVSHDKANKKELGDHTWRERRRGGGSARVVVMKLPCALGLMEIVSQAGSRKDLATLAHEKAADEYLEMAARCREWFRGFEAAGKVSYGRDEPLGALGREADWWARIRVERERGGYDTYYAHEDERLMIEGSQAELWAAAQAMGGRAAARAEKDLRGILRENKWCDQGGMRAAIRDLAEQRWDEEACREANRLYVASAEHIAGVFDDKKQCGAEHREAAAVGYLAREFGHVEVDDEVDLAEYRRLVDEFEARDRAGEMPRIDKGGHQLRFRKCGRHHATGIYSPFRKAIAVDPRAPRSLLHEFAHAYDFEHGMMSVSAAFRPILRAFRAEFRPSDEMGPGAVRYYKTPTEVFARGWEVYAAINGYGGSFVKEKGFYLSQPEYAPLAAHSEELSAYFDGFAKATAPVRAVPAQERAVGLMAEGEPGLAELRRLVAEGEVDVARLRADLEGAGLATPESHRALDGLAFTAAFAATAVSAPEPPAQGAAHVAASPAAPQAVGVPGGGEQMSLFDLASLSDEELERGVGAPMPLAAQAADARGGCAADARAAGARRRDLTAKGRDAEI